MITVTFDYSLYSVNEDVEVVQATLVFSIPSVFNETIEVTSIYVSANGMVNYVAMYCMYIGFYWGTNFKNQLPFVISLTFKCDYNNFITWQFMKWNLPSWKVKISQLMKSLCLIDNPLYSIYIYDVCIHNIYTHTHIHTYMYSTVCMYVHD